LLEGVCGKRHEIRDRGHVFVVLAVELVLLVDFGDVLAGGVKRRWAGDINGTDLGEGECGVDGACGCA
jgi:hypothetical protein